MTTFVPVAPPILGIQEVMSVHRADVVCSGASKCTTGVWASNVLDSLSIYHGLDDGSSVQCTG